MITSNLHKSRLKLRYIPAFAGSAMTFENTRHCSFTARLDCRYLLHAPEAVWIADTCYTRRRPSTIARCWSSLFMVLAPIPRSEEHTSELQSPCNLVCRLLLEKKKTGPPSNINHTLLPQLRHQ